jgi:hypothetical protein
MRFPHRAFKPERASPPSFLLSVPLFPTLPNDHAGKLLTAARQNEPVKVRQLSQIFATPGELGAGGCSALGEPKSEAVL